MWAISVDGMKQATVREEPTYAFARNQRVYTGPVQPVLLVDVTVKGSTVGVLARRGERERFECCTWEVLERAETNPLPGIGDGLVEPRQHAVLDDV
jgi:hypothetical protein